VRTTTLDHIREHVAGRVVAPRIEAMSQVGGGVASPLPDGTNCQTKGEVHQQTVSEAKELWRYEGNPN
jgi:hypothetical protein